MPVVLSNSPSVQEILWIFSRLKEKKERLALKDNPHFYINLPTTPEAYKDNLKIDPTEDFRHSDEFYVLTDRPEVVHIMTDQDWQIFGNFWCPQNAIIFKGSCGHLVVLPPPPPPENVPFLMAFQTSAGGSKGKKSSRHLLEAHAVGSASSSRHPPLQERPGTVVDCSRLSQRGAHRWPGNVRLAIFRCIVLLTSAYAFVLGEWHPIVQYVATLPHI